MRLYDLFLCIIFTIVLSFISYAFMISDKTELRKNLLLDRTTILILMTTPQ